MDTLRAFLPNWFWWVFVAVILIWIVEISLSLLRDYRTARQWEKDEKEGGVEGPHFALHPEIGETTMNLMIVPTEPPDLEYEIWGTGRAQRDRQSTRGSFSLRASCTVVDAYSAPILHGKYCFIRINYPVGYASDDEKASGVIGQVRVHEHDSRVSIEGVSLRISDHYMSDLVAMMNQYTPTQNGLFVMRLDIQNEKRFPHASGRIINFDVVRFFCWHEKDRHLLERNESYYVERYRGAAGNGYPNPQFILGTFYEEGRGVPRDFPQAHVWYSLAAEQGHKEAAQRLDLLATQMTPDQLATACRLAQQNKSTST